MGGADQFDDITMLAVKTAELTHDLVAADPQLL